MVHRRRQRGLRELCRLLGYTPQAYYQQGHCSSRRMLKEELLVQQVGHLRKQQPRLGCRKLLVLLGPFLQAHPMAIGRDAFFELLRSQGLLVRPRRGRPKTTFSAHRFKKYPDGLKGSVVSRVEQVWVSDITYINLSKGFAYLSLVTDVYSRKIVGYHVSDDLSAQGCRAALKMAIEQRTCPQKPLLHHSDRGSQYCSDGYVKLLRENQIGISMTQSGNPKDNAIAERVNGILKEELLGEVYPGFKQAQQAVDTAVEVYNHHRPHSSVDMLTPEQAHTRTGEIRRRWKSYYQAAKKEALMSG